MQAKVIIDIVYVAIILFSAVMATKYRAFLHTRQLPIMLPYLFLIFIQEVVLVLGNRDWFGYYPANAPVHNISRPLSVLAFAYVYYKIPLMAPVRKLIFGITSVYLLITVINYCFLEDIHTSGSYIVLIRNFVLTCYGLLFLYYYFHLDNTKEEKYWRPLVWITTGIVIFYPVTAISLSFQKYLAQEGATLYGLKLHQVIPKVMSIFMYSCFGYAFYLCQKKD